MTKLLKPMTKEELEMQRGFPEVYKKAIEHAIWEGIDPEEPEDEVWPDYFRASEVECLLGCELHDDDKLDEDEYVTDCVWFAAGWKAREKTAQQKLIFCKKEGTMDSLTREEVAQIGLPKWPALTVAGEKVTLEQAMQIIIRTSGFSFSSNDKAFTKDLYRILGLETDDIGWPVDWDASKAVEERYQVISLEYLGNHQIVSAFIGGPHGWCNWQGDIFCNSYNIGKHPSAEEVLAEWVTIAAAFPFLSLKSQLFNGESSEEGVIPVVEFHIAHATAKAFRPEGILVPAVSNLSVSSVRALLFPGREQGCTLDQFRQALALCDREANPAQK